MRAASHWRRNAIVAVVLALVAAGTVIIHQRRAHELERIAAPEAFPWALHTATVTRRTVKRGFPALATLTTSGEITVMGQVSGTLLKMGPREGQTVARGALLAQIDVRELREKRAALVAQLQAARADAARAADEQKREEQLFKEGGSSATEVEARRTAAVAARQKVRGLEREIAALEVRIGYGEIRAPAAGTIAARLAEPGDVCQLGHPLYRLTVAKGARVRVRLPQQILTRVHPGTRLELNWGTHQTALELTRIYPALDAHALGAAEADTDTLPFGLPSGARVPARVILVSYPEALAVPHDALAAGSTGTTRRVFKVVAEAGAAHLVAVPVVVELEGRDLIAVSGELEVGDQVVTAHQSVLLALRDGDPVTVITGATP